MMSLLFLKTNQKITFEVPNWNCNLFSILRIRVGHQIDLETAQVHFKKKTGAFDISI